MSSPIELILADQERIVLGIHRPVVVGEVQGDVVVDLHDQERPVGRGRPDPQDLGH